jgi:hypothetical protein
MAKTVHLKRFSKLRPTHGQIGGFPYLILKPLRTLQSTQAPILFESSGEGLILLSFCGFQCDRRLHVARYLRASNDNLGLRYHRQTILAGGTIGCRGTAH